MNNQPFKSTKFRSGPYKLLPPSQGVDLNWHITDEADTFVAHVYGFNHAVDEQSKIQAQLLCSSLELYEALEATTTALKADADPAFAHLISENETILSKARGEK